MAIAGKIGAVYKQTTAASVSFVGAATTDVGGLHTTYQITNTANRYLDKAQAVTVKKNGVVQTTGYTVQYPGGVVVFTLALLGTDVVTVDGYAFAVTQTAGMYDWKVSAQLTTTESTTFASGGWKEHTAALDEATATCEAWWGAEVDGSQHPLDNVFTQMQAGQPVVLALYVDATTSLARYECYAQVKKNSVQASVKDLVKQPIEFTVTGPLYYRAG